MVFLPNVLIYRFLFPLCLVKARPVGIDGAQVEARAWRNGSRNGLKIRFSKGSAGSSPAARTTGVRLPFLPLLTCWLIDESAFETWGS